MTAFGEPMQASGPGVPPVGTRYGYAGSWGYEEAECRVLDLNGQEPGGETTWCDPLAELGWLHVGHRYYDPSSGRFVQRDPIGIRGGLNTYLYVINNPLGRVDPSGLWSLRRWLFTGDGDASDDVYDAALAGAWNYLLTGTPPPYAKALAFAGGCLFGFAMKLGQLDAYASGGVVVYGLWRLGGGSTGYTAIDGSLDYFMAGTGAGLLWPRPKPRGTMPPFLRPPIGWKPHVVVPPIGRSHGG